LSELPPNDGHYAPEVPPASPADMQPTGAPPEARAGAGLAQLPRRAARWALDRITPWVPPLGAAYDAFLIRRWMRHELGYEPDLRNPRTYNEKLAWRILHDRNPLIALTSDKLAVRDYVAAKVGTDILVPLHGAYERAADIPWCSLPRRFVLKANHGSGMNLLVHDKNGMDPEPVRRQAAAWLRRNYYAETREWAYRKIKPRLLAEDMLLDEQGRIPPDLKFYVFHGRVAMLRIHLDRFGAHCVNFYDPDLRPLPFRQTFPTKPDYVPPAELRALGRLAERLAEDFDFARIDLFHVRGQVRFGEITHYDGAARVPFTPREYDRIVGNLWHLPQQ
jgi:hypothetical protein